MTHLLLFCNFKALLCLVLHLEQWPAELSETRVGCFSWSGGPAKAGMAKAVHSRVEQRPGLCFHTQRVLHRQEDIECTCAQKRNRWKGRKYPSLPPSPVLQGFGLNASAVSESFYILPSLGISEHCSICLGRVVFLSLANVPDSSWDALSFPQRKGFLKSRLNPPPTPHPYPVFSEGIIK